MSIFDNVAAGKFKDQPGLISAQLHQGIGKSNVYINYAVWESYHVRIYYQKILPGFLGVPTVLLSIRMSRGG